MSLLEALQTALSSPEGIRGAIRAAFAQCQVNKCTRPSMGVVCSQCGAPCCNGHAYIPLDALPDMVQAQRPMVECQRCIVLRATEEAR